MKDITTLDTEKVNPNSKHIDQVTMLEKLQIINNEDKKVAFAVEEQLPMVAQFCEAAVERMKRGGRLIYIGAGTSGRLGILDASECPPTYGVSYEMVQGLIAGGDSAIIKAKEGSEDSALLGKEDLVNKNLTSNDCVLGIAASGRTPYVIGALDYANEIGAYTGALSCSKNAEISKHSKTAIEVSCGPEVICGSTRMKSGTAQKMILNMISTCIMISMGKVYKNYMVDVQPTNEKLVIRAKNMISQVTGCTKEEAEKLFFESGKNVKTAIVMYFNHVDKEKAKQQLEKAEGHVSSAIG